MSEIIFGGVIIILLVKIVLMKREVRDITKQLNNYNKFHGQQKIRVGLTDRTLEDLAATINEHMHISKALQIKQRKSEEELKRMVANISHDLRTPLTSVIGNLQLIKRGKASQERQQEYVDTAYKRAKDLQGLIGDFFTLSLIESPDYVLQPEYLNLTNILYESLTDYYNRLEEKGIQPAIHIPTESVKIIVDPKALRRVLDNLFNNMLKHAGGKSSITLELEEDDVSLILVNEARHLTKQDVEQMFNRFYMADESRGLKLGNTGLGLAIVKELMDRMNGTIEARLDQQDLVLICRWKREKV